MTSVIPTICVWIPFVLNSTLPRNATVGGYRQIDDTPVSFLVYVARAWEDGELVPVTRSSTGNIAGIVFKRGTEEPVEAVLLKGKIGELLTCNTDIGELRWLKFEPKMDLENCIAHGKAQSGETGYVGRTFVTFVSNNRTYHSSLPGFFLPSEGFITVQFGSLYHSSDVELLCVI